MKTTTLALTVLATICTLAVSAQQPNSDREPAGAAYEGRAFQFHQIRDNVYHAVGTGELSVICNSTIIINERDVMVVDSPTRDSSPMALAKTETAVMDVRPVLMRMCS